MASYTIKNVWSNGHGCGWSCEHNHSDELDAIICVVAHSMHCVKPGDTPEFNHARAIDTFKDIIYGPFSGNRTGNV